MRDNKWREEGTQFFTVDEAMAEAQRCLNCPKPLCRTGCPIENEIPDFIHQIALGNFGEAKEIIGHRSNLGMICGIVCPKEKQCEGHCIMNKAKKTPIQIGKLESFAVHFANTKQKRKPFIVKDKKEKVAIVGSGPAGLSAATDLAQKGYQVTVFEASDIPGGILSYGIPEFRLAKPIVQEQIDIIKEFGVVFECNTMIGANKTINSLFEDGFEAVLITVGAMASTPLSIEGINYQGVLSYKEVLEPVQKAMYRDMDPIRLAKETNDLPIKAGDKVLVVGAGNVAMDVSRVVKRLGAETTVVYRRGAANMPASLDEYEGAMADGVTFAFYSSPVAITGEKEKVTGLMIEKQKIMEDGSMVSTGIREIIPADIVIPAIGSIPDPSVYSEPITAKKGSVKTDEKGYIETVKEPFYGMTSCEAVFAAGDIVHRPETVVMAMREGKKAAAGIDAYLTEKR